MVTPNVFAGDQFYKVGNYITFAWNYTSLSVTPSAIDVLASCSANQATYTIAVNVSAQETKVIWDTKNTPDGQAPFLTEKYTLLIYDAESSVTAAPRPGYLAAFNQFTFGMYTPQPYVEWESKAPPTPLYMNPANSTQNTNAQTASRTAPSQTRRNSPSKSCSSPPAQQSPPCSTSPTTLASSRSPHNRITTSIFHIQHLFIFHTPWVISKRRRRRSQPGASNGAFTFLETRGVWELVLGWEFQSILHATLQQSQSHVIIYANLRKRGGQTLWDVIILDYGGEVTMSMSM